MHISGKNLSSWRGAARLATFVITMGLPLAHAQTQNPPYSKFQYSSLTSSGNTIVATRVPVVTAAGITIYKDLTIQFDVDGDGNLTLSSGFPLITDAPGLLVSSFKPGRYVGPSTIRGGKMFVTVSGPGVLPGGATVWSLAASDGADQCTYPGTASWYTGLIESSPLATRIKNDKITSTAWSFGVASQTCPFFGSNPNWPTNSLIGVNQVGNTLVIASFSTGNFDYTVPTEQITYTLVPEKSGN